MRLVKSLEESQQEFLAAAATVPAALAQRRPGDDAWSALELIEHVVIVEERYLDWIRSGDTIRAKPDSTRESKLFFTIRSRSSKVPAVDAVLPQGRYRDLASALEAFRQTRAKTIDLVRDRAESLYEVGVRHPFFGRMNAVEMLQLIEGHCHRHTDQLREIAEALAAARQTTAASHCEPPDLPATFAQAPDDVSEPLEAMVLNGRDLAGLKLDRLRADGCLFERVRLADARISALVLKDVRLVNCDLANLRASRMNLHRVELIDCRLTGLQASSAIWQNVLVRNSDLRWTQLAEAKLHRCELDHSNLCEADLQRADLGGSLLRHCDLASTDLRGARLANTDLRGSGLDSVVLNANDVHGAIVDADQAIVLARVFGLQVR